MHQLISENKQNDFSLNNSDKIMSNYDYSQNINIQNFYKNYMISIGVIVLIFSIIIIIMSIKITNGNYCSKPYEIIQHNKNNDESIFSLKNFSKFNQIDMLNFPLSKTNENLYLYKNKSKLNNNNQKKKYFYQIVNKKLILI